jgi:arsenate reductase (thioredoxin)
MAAAFFNQLADPLKAKATSAGTEPGECVHPEVQAVMREIGLGLGDAKPQKLTEDLAKDAQLLITMGCGDKCPHITGLPRDDWPFRDSKGLPIEEVRAIRDEVKSRIEALVKRENLS